MTKMIFARPDGQWFDFPPLDMAAMSGDHLIVPTPADLIPLPEGATLSMMPLTAPIGFDAEAGEFLSLDENPYKKKSEPVYAVAALLPQGFTRLMLPAATQAAEELPILGYTAVGVHKGQLMVAAAATDEHRRWHPRHFNTPQLDALVKQRQAEFPDNRIIRQLSRCALEYGCFTAQNMFYRRWEAGLPASPACNAACLACLSEQQGAVDSPQQRISFCPQTREIVELAVAHLSQAEEAMVSFGQGCEGEPSLAHEVIAAAIPEIRRHTQRGVINMNTNAGNTAAVEHILSAGLDSLRVSLFSALDADYAAYHRPKDFTLADVRASLAAAQKQHVPVALNLLAYPGFTDQPEQLDALCELIATYGVRQVQMRNLNCDPTLMQPFVAGKSGLSMRAYLTALQQRCPELEIGSYSHDLR